MQTTLTVEPLAMVNAPIRVLINNEPYLRESAVKELVDALKGLLRHPTDLLHSTTARVLDDCGNECPTVAAARAILASLEAQQ